MPFDGTQFPSNIALAKIDRVIDFLSDEDRWCKGVVRSADGRRCIIGALLDADARSLLEPTVREAIREVTGQMHWRLECFNDAATTTHSEVLAVLHQARADILSGRTVVHSLPQRIGFACRYMMSRLHLW